MTNLPSLPKGSALALLRAAKTPAERMKAQAALGQYVTTPNFPEHRMSIPTQSDIPMHGWYPYHLIHRERIRAHQKHDSHGNSMERSSWDDPRWLPVLTEEVGELARAVRELTRRDPMSDNERAEWLTNLRGELIQVGAMAMAWFESFPRESIRHES